jgi:hypothetical protein
LSDRTVLTDIDKPIHRPVEFFGNGLDHADSNKNLVGRHGNSLGVAIRGITA